jgi:hypothetical protein
MPLSIADEEQRRDSEIRDVQNRAIPTPVHE